MYSKTSLARTHITQTFGLRGLIFLVRSKDLGFIQRCRRITQTQHGLSGNTNTILARWVPKYTG